MIKCHWVYKANVSFHFISLSFFFYTLYRCRSTRWAITFQKRHIRIWRTAILVSSYYGAWESRDSNAKVGGLLLTVQRCWRIEIECGYNCHRKCQSAAPKCARAITHGFLDDTDTASNSRAEKYLRQLSQKSTLTDRRPSTSSSTSSKHVKLGGTSVYQSTFEHVKAIATSDKLQHILAEAATTEQVPVNAYLAQQAPLNPQITARNFTRFVSRCGPVFAFRDELLLLLSWENRVDTLVSLIIYCLICKSSRVWQFGVDVSHWIDISDVM